MTRSELIDELIALNPAQTEPHRELIKKCVNDLIAVIPKGMTEEDYLKRVEEALKVRKLGRDRKNDR